MERGGVENRLDPLYYTDVKSLIEKSKFPLRKIKEFVKDLKSGFGAGKQDQATEEDGIIQIRPTNLDNNGLLKFDKNVYVPKSWATPNATLRYGDIIFNNTNSQELVGKTGYFDLDDANYVFSNHITRIRVNERIVMPKYLQIIFNFYQSKQVFYAICTNWNNQSGIGNELLLNLNVPIPPLSIQHEIVEKMDMAYQHKKLKEAESAQILSNIDDYILDRL